jgi:hypothetical protein
MTRILKSAENPFFKFKCSKGSRIKFECSQYGDSKTIVLSTKHATEEEFTIQIWDRFGESLAFQHKMFREHLASRNASLMNRVEGGRSASDVELCVNGTFSNWKGCCVVDQTPNGVFCDYEFLGETPELVASARCFVSKMRSDADTIVKSTLGTLRVDLPSSWVIGKQIAIRDVAA